MILIKIAQLHFLIKTRQYGKLREHLDKYKKDNLYVCNYIFEVLSNIKGDEKRRNKIYHVLCCLDSSYVDFALTKLINSKSYDINWLKDVLTNSRISRALNGKKEKYLEKYINNIDVYGVIGIISIYNCKATSEKEKEFIKDEVYKLLEKRPDLASCFAYNQGILGKEIIPLSFLEDVIIGQKNVEAMHGVMLIENCNRKKMLRELGKIKDESSKNSECFLKAVACYAPSVLAKVTIEELVRNCSFKAGNVDYESAEYAIRSVEKFLKKQEEDSVSRYVKLVDKALPENHNYIDSDKKANDKGKPVVFSK